MKKEFGRIITSLRKKQGLSQKQAAQELGISQALLSHYEKGIRECGLEFLVRAADYFEVSVDYLLGRTLNTAEDRAEPEDITDTENIGSYKKTKNTYCLLNRRLIVSSTAVIYSLLDEINSKTLSKYVTDYLTTAHYNMFRSIYSLKENNPESLFNVSPDSYHCYCDASLSACAGKIRDLRERVAGVELSEDIIAVEYNESYSSLHSLIKNTEKSMSQRFKL